ncbi:MAG: ABC transporter permease [Promethearchaeota archaeon]
MKKTRKYRRSWKERYGAYIRSFLGEKRGVFGLCLLLFFGFMGILIPILAEADVIPPPIGIDSYVTSNNLPPDWVEVLPQSLIPGSGNIVPDPKFEKTDSWTFNVSDPSILEFNYDTEEFIAGSRSIRFSFTDNSSSLSHQGNAKGNLIFHWPFNPPTNASLTWEMKIHTENISISSFTPYVKLHPPEWAGIYGEASRFNVFPPPHSEWMSYWRGIPFTPMILIFQPNSSINLEIGVNFRQTTPSLTGKVEIWFDQIELHITRPTYGVLGSNHQGQDIFVQLCYSIQASFFIAFLAGISSLILGVIIGIIAGYRGGLFDTITMRIIDLFLVYPNLLIIFLLMALLHTMQIEVSLIFLSLLIAFFSWPSTARIIRSKVLTEREQLYIESAKASGANDLYIMFRNILPNILGLIFVQFTINAATAINIETGLSFLDYPIQYGNESIERREKKLESWFSWGFMLAEAYYEGGISVGAWWAVIPPGLCLVLIGASFMFIGNALDRVFNPLKFQDRSFKRNFRG